MCVALSVCLSLSLSLSLCKGVLLLGLLENDDWHWRDNLICRCGGFWKKKTVWIVSLGLLPAASWKVEIVSRRTRLEISLCVTGDSFVVLPLLKLLTDLGSGRVFRRRFIHCGNWKLTRTSITFSFTTNHYQPLQLLRPGETSPRKRLFAKATSKDRARDNMDTGAHDMVRDDIQISHFLGMIGRWSLRFPRNKPIFRSSVEQLRSCGTHEFVLRNDNGPYSPKGKMAAAYPPVV